jgi:hypothetical protein
MRTEFVEIQIPATHRIGIQPAQIEAALQPWGEPLRWAITKIAHGYYHLEAIVTIDG